MTNSASAGDMTFFTVKGGVGNGGFIVFLDAATAGNGTYVVEPAQGNHVDGASISFGDSSTAGNGTFTILASSDSSAESGSRVFLSDSNAGNGTFIVEGGGVSFFSTNAAAGGTATFIINGSSAENAGGGSVSFFDGGAGSATLIANPGTNGGDGGLIKFFFDPDGGEARIEVFGNGTLDVSSEGAAVGSIEGDGLVLLGSHKLTTGSNNLSTTFSGTIQDTGSLEKIGTGTLILSSENMYTGGTTVSSGTLRISSQTGSGTGTGAVTVNGGILAGHGIIAGPVTIGTGSGAGAFLSPSKGAHHPGALSLQSSLTFKADGTYEYKLNTRRARADQVIVNGVTIESGAQFNLYTFADRKLNVGQVFTAISNTSAAPIAGTFANLGDGGTITVGNNTYEADYQGGDGNDLTLTVVP